MYAKLLTALVTATSFLLITLAFINTSTTAAAPTPPPAEQPVTLEVIIPKRRLSDRATTGSATLLALESQAAAMSDNGQVRQAIVRMQDYAQSAAPTEAGWSKLVLAHLFVRANDRDPARALYEELLANPALTPVDGLQAQAALRLAALEKGERRRAAAEKFLNAKLAATNEEYCEALLIVIEELRAKRDYDSAFVYALSVRDHAKDQKQWARTQNHIAAIAMWQARGGHGALAEHLPADRAAAFEAGRTAMNAVIATIGKVPDTLAPQQIHANALLVECYMLEKRTRDCYEESGRFIERWGSKPERYPERRTRQAVNDVRVWRMAGAYEFGEVRQALDLAKEIDTTPPAKADESQGQNAVIYSKAIGMLAATALSEKDTADTFRREGLTLDSNYFNSIVKTLSRKRALAPNP